jgi:thiosulfate/3-mercaptopyruvate sulfurtransferase
MSLVLPDRLVSTDWLGANLGDPDLRIFDCSVTLVPTGSGVRPESGRAAWEQTHIPGSGFADLLEDLSDKSQPLPIMMPPAAQFATAMGRYGVGPTSAVILYDSGPHTWATRVWWMLRAMGFDNAAVLDGGLKKWKAERRALSTDPCTYPPAHFAAHPQERVFVGKDHMRRLYDQPQFRLINALSADEHAGRLSRTARPGRIPGSGNVPAGSLLDPAAGTFLPLAQLRDKFLAQGALDGRSVITYCGGGIAATCDAFTLVRLGVPDVSVYDGSLTEWSRDDSLPMECDGFIPS